jgi:hypothetical protein
LTTYLHKILKTSLSLLRRKSNLELVKHLPNNFKVSIHNISNKDNDWLHDKLNEATRKLTTLTIIRVCGELFFGWVEIVVTPKLRHKLLNIKLELLRVGTSKSG